MKNYCKKCGSKLAQLEFTEEDIHKFEIWQEATDAFDDLYDEVEAYLTEMDEEEETDKFYDYLKSKGKTISSKMVTEVTDEEIERFLEVSSATLTF